MKKFEKLVKKLLAFLLKSVENLLQVDILDSSVYLKYMNLLQKKEASNKILSEIEKDLQGMTRPYVLLYIVGILFIGFFLLLIRSVVAYIKTLDVIILVLMVFSFFVSIVLLFVIISMILRRKFLMEWLLDKKEELEEKLKKI